MNQNLQKKFVKPEEIKWSPNPALPIGAQEAIILGNPSAQEEYVIRIRLPAGVKVMPHSHPEDRVYTVISGEFMIGLGEVFNEEGLALLPPGSVAVVPGGTNHFQYSESEEYVVQVQGHGPAATNYVNRNDDPRA